MEDKKEIFLTRAELASVVARLAKQLRSFYCPEVEGGSLEEAGLAAKGKPPVVISILNGAFVFTADLIRAMAMPVELDFMRAASYGMRDTPAEKVSILMDITADIEDREVLIIEDIVDRGLTLKAVRERLMSKGPADIKVCALLMRSSAPGNNSRTEEEPFVDFIGRRIEDGFVVGYGMDYKECYRELSELHILRNGSPVELKGDGDGA